MTHGLGRLNVITQQYRESTGDRKWRGGLAEATNERTNVNYVPEKCNYRTVYSNFVDVDSSFNYRDCDYRHFACVELNLDSSCNTKLLRSALRDTFLHSTFLLSYSCTDTDSIIRLFYDTESTSNITISW